MIIKAGKIHLNIELKGTISKDKIPLVFLHGFTGSAKDWLPLWRQLPSSISAIAIDMPGHGKSLIEQEQYYSNRYLQLSLFKLFTALDLDRINLVGYSMGGRAALAFALRYPSMIQSLVLESASPGIRSRTERTYRRENDEKLAQLIESQGIANFIDFWLNIPLFDSQKQLPEIIRKKIYQNKLNNNISGLTKSLRQFGTGSFPNLWPKIDIADFPVLLLTGDQDKKFTSINSNMAVLMKTAEHKIIISCGHNIHLERLEVYLNLILDFIKKTNPQV